MKPSFILATLLLSVVLASVDAGYYGKKDMEGGKKDMEGKKSGKKDDEEMMMHMKIMQGGGGKKKSSSMAPGKGKPYHMMYGSYAPGSSTSAPAAALPGLPGVWRRDLRHHHHGSQGTTTTKEQQGGEQRQQRRRRQTSSSSSRRQKQKLSRQHFQKRGSPTLS
mmetsp:Transcript_13632/g.37681  ORF Transcript_13632/g.37681 Transcript_13632/m.37681 type:complete len:164 (-) Transcript_13632:179-670(-)